MGELRFPQLDDYDWREAFVYAHGKNVVPAIPGAACNLTGIDREDVADLCGTIDGENDGPPWRAWGRVDDGRWFYLEAGCDYTGWDCQAGGTTTVALTREDIIRYGMTDEARKLFGLELPATDAKRLEGEG